MKEIINKVFLLSIFYIFHVFSFWPNYKICLKLKQLLILY